MPQALKPVAPSVKDVRKQIRKAIKDLKAEQTKKSAARAARAGRLATKISGLNARLASAGNDNEKKKRLKKLEEVVGEHHRRSSSLNRQAEGDKLELKLLKKELANMKDLAD
jgi:vacuolar-type H+-ATPase subunit I/STV1